MGVSGRLFSSTLMERLRRFCVVSFFTLGWSMLCISACDSVSFPSLPQFSPLPVVLWFDKPKVLAAGVNALEGRGGGSGAMARADFEKPRAGSAAIVPSCGHQKAVPGAFSHLK